MARRHSALTLAVLLLAAPAAAQDSGDPSGSAPAGTPFSGSGVFRRITVKDSLGVKTTISQLSAPLGFRARVTGDLTLVFYGAYVRTEIRPDSGGAARRLAGLADTRARLVYRAGRTVLAAGVSLPTGKHSLTSDEETIATVAATDVYGFPARRLGEGLGAQAGVTHAVAVGGHGALAIGVAYLYRGSFTPSVSAADKYRPGAELSASAGYDYATAATLLRVNAAVRAYSKDQAGGVPVYRQGTALVFEERWVARSTGRLTNDLTLHQVLKGPSDYFGGTGGAVVSGSTENGSGFGLVERLEIGAGHGVRLAATAEGRFYGKNDSGFDSAQLAGLGGEIAWLPSPRASLRISGRVLTGSADPGNIKLSGLEVGASLRVAM